MQYLLQSAIVLTILYIPFQLLLRKEHYFALNRAILVTIMLVSLVLPLTHHTLPARWLEWSETETLAMNNEILRNVTTETETMMMVTDKPEISFLQQYGESILIGLWVLGALTLILWQTKGGVKLYQILYGKDCIRQQLPSGHTLCISTSPIPSFSWMNHIVISSDDYAENGEIILAHEEAHIAHHHSLDKILLLLCQTLQWWNPFVWLMTDALYQVHEYEADQSVIAQGINARQYQLLLICKAAGPAGLAMVNGFKHNKLKSRIIMMNNKTILRGAKCRYLALLPMLLIAIVCTASTDKTKINLIQSSQEANDQAMQYIKDVKEGRIKPTGNDFFMLQDLDVPPTFPNGGDMMEYINQNFTYPAKAAEKDIQGTIIVQFCIWNDGRVSNAKAISNDTNDKELAAEAERVIASMPQWTPGQINGQNVGTSMYVPVIINKRNVWHQAISVNAVPAPYVITDNNKQAQPLIILGDETIVDDLKKINKDSIESIYVFKDEEAKKKFIHISPLAKNGVVQIIIKEGKNPFID